MYKSEIALPKFQNYPGEYEQVEKLKEDSKDSDADHGSKANISTNKTTRNNKTISSGK